MNYLKMFEIENLLLVQLSSVLKYDFQHLSICISQDLQ